LAVANPIPLLPPVMTATLPSSFFIAFYPLLCVGREVPERFQMGLPKSFREGEITHSSGAQTNRQDG
jgi:hypothetical protein